ncbi:hypothetical protein GCM10010236_56980 [Streptomyces eurythermus]|nr:hypothetical protein GCM10010236_56980 [Streptomyces eurythermus]
MTVRIPATDRADGGTGAEGAVEIVRAFAAHGADAVDVPTGQVVAEERAESGRSHQTRTRRSPTASGTRSAAR